LNLFGSLDLSWECGDILEKLRYSGNNPGSCTQIVELGLFRPLIFLRVALRPYCRDCLTYPAQTWFLVMDFGCHLSCCQEFNLRPANGTGRLLLGMRTPNIANALPIVRYQLNSNDVASKKTACLSSEPSSVSYSQFIL
jgi:hypothetical protein